MNLNIKKLRLLKIIITLLLFYGAFQFEDALKYRAIIFVLIFSTYIVLNILRNKVETENIKVITYIIELGLIFMMEHNSRYLMMMNIYLKP